MMGRSLPALLGFAAALALSACQAAETKPQGETGSYKGWYLERAGQGYFQPCSSQEQWRVSDKGDVHAQAARFGLDENTPVYVVLSGEHATGTLDVKAVTQFGSPTPVRDCPMTGVAIPPSSFR